MKKIVFCLMVAFLSMTFLPLQLNGATVAEPSSVVDPKPAESAEAKTLLLRLDEINAMDKSKMNASEKKEFTKRSTGQSKTISEQ